MKSLLSISLLSVLLSVCNSKADKQTETETEEAAVTTRIDSARLPSENVVMEAAEPAVDGAIDQPESKPASTKPAYEGTMPDTSVKKIVEHGAPDKARNDSVKAAKTKGKF
ncbi:MAG: hypothetical protein K9J17_09470 [Flavobacteriales bacterium]|nr:hypothetical protein [Flavobacteriales bacterium]